MTKTCRDMLRISCFFLLSLAVGCEPSGVQAPVESFDTPSSELPAIDLVTDDGSTPASPNPLPFAVEVKSEAATRIEVWVYADPWMSAPVATRVLDQVGADFAASFDVEGIPMTQEVLYYGFRAWGPNWTFDADWVPGSENGFNQDVDGDGNRFNPNKLLTDPRSLEVSHDPIHSEWTDGTVYATGPLYRNLDSGGVAPKSIYISDAPMSDEPPIVRPLAEDIIYETHVRGFTALDESIPLSLRGTYAGAALKADYLADLGITAIEFLPVHETQNQQNDMTPDSTEGDNYWGYASNSFFSLERRYASDKSAGGPSREFAAMVDAFHERDIKVFIDVVFNHTGEGGLWSGESDTASLLSWRGLDNAGYYQLAEDPAYYYDNNGVGPNFNAAVPLARDYMFDALRKYRDVFAIDGYRFDLASVLGNECVQGCFSFDKFNPDNILNRAARDLPARDASGSGVDLIAEPWAIGAGTYQLGEFPAGWSEWNAEYRDTVRKDQNELGLSAVTLGALANLVGGSASLFGDDGRAAANSINFISAHDGLTHNDIYACNGSDNGQSWPFGPSDGGHSENHSWDQGGDRALQLRASRTAMALLGLSKGTPMIQGGDESLRTLQCNNNAYNLDSTGNYTSWMHNTEQQDYYAFVRSLFNLRNEIANLKVGSFLSGEDTDGDDVPGVQWFHPDGNLLSDDDFNDSNQHAMLWRVDESEVGGEGEYAFAYNGDASPRTFMLPLGDWNLVCDTSTGQPCGESAPVDAAFSVNARSLAVFYRD